MVGWAFMCWYIAAIGVDRLVKSRITRPGLEHALVEVVAIHFCPEDGPIYPLGDGPIAGIHGQELGLELFELGLPFLESGSGVIGSLIK